MTPTQILTFAGFGLFSILMMPAAWRRWVWFLTGLVAVYWLQPSTPIRNLDFWFPSLGILIAILSWAAIQKPGAISKRSCISFILTGVCIALIGLTRYIEPFCCITATRPPPFWQIAAFLAVSATLTAILRKQFSRHPRLLDSLTLGLILAFVIIKSPAFSQAVSASLRTQAGQSAELASAFDLRWLGFSYLAFRLLHTLRDARAGRMPDVELDEYLTYAFFWSTYTAGPIDRVTRFITDIRQAAEQRFTLTISPENPIWSGLWRIVWGAFKKFAIADTLALIALNETNAVQVTTSGWMWFLLYAYSLRIYLDFSGYTDIAIGLGSLIGLKLPENFDNPYSKTNLTAFWNSWHITLAQWFRAYFFNPLTRSLRNHSRNMPAWLIIWITQISTMALIGIWHGITVNFLIWGTWHGMGLFIHNRWLDLQRRYPIFTPKTAFQAKIVQLLGWFLTFQYVTVGWIWFALPQPPLAKQVLGFLFGF